MSNPASKTNKPDVPYPVLNQEQEVRIFKSLAHLSYIKSAKANGLHLIEPEASDGRMLSIVQTIVRKISKAPELWGLSKDSVQIVQEALDRRSIRKNPGLRADIAIQEESFRDKLDTMRDTVAEIITKKLKKYNTVSGIKEISIRDLKDLLGMAIDKGRLLRGESTENIKKMSPIDTDNMTPEDALKVIMKAREAMLDNKK